MHKLIPGIAAVALLASAVTLAPRAGAQTPPAAGAPAQVLPPGTPPGPMGGPPPGHGWGGGPMMPMMRSPNGGPDGGPWGRPWAEQRARHAFFSLIRTWGLFHRPADLALSPADVQTIAEAILLRNGEHDWKVGDVTANADHTVSFAFVTAHGDVIAQFVMDTQNGRISRTD